MSNNDKKELEEIMEQIKAMLTDVNLDDVSINVFITNHKKGDTETCRYKVGNEFKEGKSNDSCGSSKKQSSCKDGPEELTTLENKMLDIARNVALMAAADIRQHLNVFIQELAQSCTAAFKKMNAHSYSKEETTHGE